MKAHIRLTFMFPLQAQLFKVTKYYYIAMLSKPGSQLTIRTTKIAPVFIHCLGF
jgi:hypothetical protein